MTQQDELLRRVAPAAATGRPQNRGPRRLGARIWVTSVLLVAVAISAFPLYWMFVVASNSNAVMSQVPPPIAPGPNFWTNVVNVFSLIPFGRVLLNSLFISGTITFSVLFFSTLAGFAFAKLRFRGRGMLFAFIVGTMMVPQQLGLIPMYMLMVRFGWVNDYRAVIVPALVTAFGVFWMRQYLSTTIPDELLESGRLDGCSTFSLFWHIVIPAARPAAAVLGLFTFLGVWNDFLWPLVILQRREMHTVQIALHTLNDAYYTDYSMVMAGTLLGVLPTLIIFLLFARQMVSGIMEGSVKG